MQPRMSMAMNNHSLDSKAVSSKAWTLMPFAQAFLEIMNRTEINGRKELTEREMAKVQKTPKHQECEAESATLPL